MKRECFSMSKIKKRVKTVLWDYATCIFHYIAHYPKTRGKSLSKILKELRT